MYCFAIAAEFIAGEGLGGIVNAVLTIAGISGTKDIQNWISSTEEGAPRVLWLSGTTGKGNRPFRIL
jgi:hypothetical protein